MRIDELTIKNFKGFENETFHFNQQFNVVIGKNASGKTSLLDAVSVAVGCYFLKIARTDARMITSLDVRRELIDGQPKIIDPVIISAKGEIHNQKLTWDRRYDFNHFVYSKEGDASITGGEALANIAMNDLALSRTRGVETTFPLILYYGTNRLWNQQEHINYFKQEEGFLIAYKDCLSGYASSEIFLSWYKTYEDEVSKFQQPADEILLKLFRDTISAVIPEWTSMAYSHKDGDLIGTFKDEDGQINRLPFSNLSDGYRNMIGMVADMVFRCIQLNPGLKERAVADTEGIVLIDEIDLHLHPQWQLTIVDSLKKVFPKIQFIVTTHSPFIVQSLKKEELIVLDNEVISDKDPWRESIEEIAENEMQVPDVPRSSRFKEMVAIAKEYFTLVKENDDKDTLRDKIRAAKTRLDELRVRFADDPAYVAMLEAQLEKSQSYEAGN